MNYTTTKRDIRFDSFNDAVQYIEKRTSPRNGNKPKLMHNTFGRIWYEDGKPQRVDIMLHWTVIYSIDKNTAITLNSGGWHSVTTKDRMNRFLPYGWRVFQRDFQWFVGRRIALLDLEFEYEEGFRIQLEI